MHCFYHSNIDSVGICKTCGKGLCHDCAEDLAKGIACKATCVEYTTKLIAMIDKNLELTERCSNIINQSKTSIIASSSLALASGLLFSIYGCLKISPVSFISILGYTFILYGIFTLYKRLAKQ